MELKKIAAEWKMNPKERYLKIREVFLAASNLPATEQLNYAKEACKDYPSLIDEIEKMLNVEKNNNEKVFDKFQQQIKGVAENIVVDSLPKQNTDSEKYKTVVESSTSAKALHNKLDDALDQIEVTEVMDNQELLKKFTDIGSISSEFLEKGSIVNNRYKIESDFDSGGFAIVYLAKDLLLNSRPVIIKILREGMDKETDIWINKKFLDEIKALSKISHPNVVSIHDSGKLEDGRPFFVMEYIQGKTLRRLLYRENLGLLPSRVANIITQLGNALTIVHEKGIYHRDLKPENIIVQVFNELEHIKVIDFGLAIVKESPKAITMTNSVSGTPVYMAPEQLEAKPTAASDIYAMGVIAYELLTGRPPFNIHYFPNTKTISMLKELQKKPIIAPSLLSPHLSPSVDDVTLKALSTEVKERYAKPNLFAEALSIALRNS